jgi:hypothetical protein
VRCPACGFSAAEERFRSGCPSCGYSAPPGREKNRVVYKTDPLPFWFYMLAAAIVTGILAVLVFSFI